MQRPCAACESPPVRSCSQSFLSHCVYLCPPKMSLTRMSNRPRSASMRATRPPPPPRPSDRRGGHCPRRPSRASARRFPRWSRADPYLRARSRDCCAPWRTQRRQLGRAQPRSLVLRRGWLRPPRRPFPSTTYPCCPPYPFQPSSRRRAKRRKRKKYATRCWRRLGALASGAIRGRAARSQAPPLAPNPIKRYLVDSPGCPPTSTALSCQAGYPPSSTRAWTPRLLSSAAARSPRDSPR